MRTTYIGWKKVIMTGGGMQKLFELGTREQIAITQYSCTVYRDCYGLFPLKTIYKDILHFHFQYEVDFTFNNIRVEST